MCISFLTFTLYSYVIKCDIFTNGMNKIMNEENICTVDVLKKRFECFQNSKKPVHRTEDKRHEKNVKKKVIKRTPAFRRDVNISKKLMNPSQAPLAVTNNVNQFNGTQCDKILQIDSHSYKTDNLNNKFHLDQLKKNNEDKFLADQKAQLIHCLQKKLENNSVVGCKPKAAKKSIESTLKTPLPVGPPPKKPPRTFAHDKKFDSDFPLKYTMELNKNSKSDPKVMLQKLEKFVSDNSHTYGPKVKKATEHDYTVKKNSKKSNLFNLAKSLKRLENEHDNSLKIYHADEQNYLTTKSICKNNTEHIYDEPIFLKPNSRLNINSVDNCHESINNEWVCDSDKSNLHYMVRSKY